MFQDKIAQYELLKGLLEARDVIDARVAEIEGDLGLTPEETEGAMAEGDGSDPLVQNAATARKALAAMRQEYKNLGGTGTFSKSKLEALRRRRGAKTLTASS